MVRVSPGSPIQWYATLSPSPACDVPVDAVVGHVELAAREPLGERQVPLEGGLEGCPPGQLLPGELRPERLEVLVGVRPAPAVALACAANAGSGGKVRRSIIRFSISGDSLMTPPLVTTRGPAGPHLPTRSCPSPTLRRCADGTHRRSSLARRPRRSLRSG